MNKEREIWIDNVKVTACLLVLLGHLLQSMTTERILPENELYLWFDKSIYYFHVPLFFICSGYLYQKFSRVENLDSWSKNVLKKFLLLGIPYFTFTLATWLVKSLVGGAGNNEINNIMETLFLRPTAPFWYLYTLFFVFLVTVTFRDAKYAFAGVTAAAFMKLISIAGLGEEILPFAFSSLLKNEIWFVIGMCLCLFHFREKLRQKWLLGGISGIAFLLLSVILRTADSRMISFLLGLTASLSVVAICMTGKSQGFVMSSLSKYTMPIFLMHSMFAASMRCLLLNAGVRNAAVHVSLGIAVSILGPIAAAMIMKKTKYLEFFIYPEKYMKWKSVSADSETLRRCGS